MLPASVGVLHYRCFAYRHLSPPETLCLNSTLSSEQNYWHCAHSMRSRVYETVGRLFVRPSVRPIIRPLHATAPGLLLWARRAGNIDRLLHGRRSAAAAPQHGAQQQMWAVPRAPLPPLSAKHRLVIFCKSRPAIATVASSTDWLEQCFQFFRVFLY